MQTTLPFYVLFSSFIFSYLFHSFFSCVLHLEPPRPVRSIISRSLVQYVSITGEGGSRRVKIGGAGHAPLPFHVICKHYYMLSMTCNKCENSEINVTLPMKNQAQNINHKRSSVGPDFEWTPTLWGGGAPALFN